MGAIWGWTYSDDGIDGEFWSTPDPSTFWTTSFCRIKELSPCNPIATFFIVRIANTTRWRSTMMWCTTKSFGSTPRRGAESLFQIEQCHFHSNDQKGNDRSDNSYNIEKFSALNETRVASLPIMVTTSQPWKRSQLLAIEPRMDRLALCRSRRIRDESLI